MKTYLYSAVFAAALMCPGGYAQTNDAHANIPFNFRVGDAAMPAGTYSIRDAQGMLSIREVYGNHGAFSLTSNSASRPKATTAPTLTFKRYGEDYYLTSVWPAASKEGRSLAQSKRQRALANEPRRVETAEVAVERASR